MTEQRKCPLCEQDAGGNRICERCVRATERRLGDVPALVDELRLTVSRQGRGGGGSGHRKRGDDQPLPYNAGASGKRALIDLLAEWADLAAAESHAGGIPWHHTHWPGDEAGQARAAVSVLQRHITWFRVAEQAPAAARVVENVRDQLRAAIDRIPERLWAGPCQAKLPADVTEHEGLISVELVEGVEQPECALQLYREWGKDVITCDGYHDPDGRGGCGATYTIDGRRDWLLIALEEEILPLRLVWESLYELLPGFALSWETVRKWPRKQTKNRRDPRTGEVMTDRRGHRLVTAVPPRLHVHTVTALGVELFRGGDILELARDEMPRRGAKRTRRRQRKSA